MYRALDLYPLDKERKEKTIQTRAVLRRIGTLPESLKFPVWLSDYLDLAEKYHWDISRDVNYAYAEVLYPPEDIKRRLLRMYPGNGKYYAYEELSFMLSIQSQRVRDVIYYGKRRESSIYAKIMFALSAWEQANHCSDAIDFEE